MAGEERPLDRREPNADADCRSPGGEAARHEEFVVAKAAVRCLRDVLRGAQFVLGIGIDAGI